MCVCTYVCMYARTSVGIIIVYTCEYNVRMSVYKYVYTHIHNCTYIYISIRFGYLSIYLIGVCDTRVSKL